LVFRRETGSYAAGIVDRFFRERALLGYRIESSSSRPGNVSNTNRPILNRLKRGAAAPWEIDLSCFQRSEVMLA
jgi:hypothetical protein